MNHLRTFEKFDTLKFQIDDVNIQTSAKNQPKIKPVSVSIKTEASQEEVKELLDYFVFELTDKNLHPTNVTGKVGAYPTEGSEYNVHFKMSNGDVLQVYFDGDDVWTLDVNKPDGSNEEFDIDGSEDLQDLLNRYMTDFSKRNTLFQEEEYSPMPKNSKLKA